MSLIARLEERLGHRFGRTELLEQALTHRSYGTPNNERLEFLGDGVLGCVVAQTLVERFPALSEGELSVMRANLVRESSLAAVARSLELAACLRLGQGEGGSGSADRPSLLADGLEALYGAIFLDAGYEAARLAVLRTLGAALEQASGAGAAKDPKTRLQERLQARRVGLPRYEVVATQGADHRQTFEVECRVEQLGLRARGNGTSRRAAEQEAASGVLALLDA